MRTRISRYAAEVLRVRLLQVLEVAHFELWTHEPKFNVCGKWLVYAETVTNIISHFSPVITSERSLKAFHLTLAEQLIGSYCSCKRSGCPSIMRSASHPPPPLPSPEADSPPASQRHCTSTRMHLPCHQAKKRCLYCREYRTVSRRRETVWYCGECEDRPALCLTGRGWV